MKFFIFLILYIILLIIFFFLDFVVEIKGEDLKFPYICD